MSAIDLFLRYAIISIAFQLACAWAYTFQSPWPLVDAFQLAPSAKDQLFQSLGIRFDPAMVASCQILLLLRQKSLMRLAQLIDNIKAMTAICTATKTIANATYALSAPWRLTSWTSPWSYKKSLGGN